jgi:thiol-disulfide isomerase/thioredoxin
MNNHLFGSFLFVIAALAVLSAVSAKGPVMQLPDEGAMPTLAPATAWLNSPPLDAAGLRGKVVLVDFWTYTCINWRRTLPWLRAWATKYRDQGLVVVGVHTPEFGFEADVDNVRRAAREQDVRYPIAIDSERAIWDAFGNRFWPAVYVVDAKGRVRHHQFGEGDYGQLEGVIQQLLAEAGHAVAGATPPHEFNGAEHPAEWLTLGSPETYLGYGRSDSFVSATRMVLDRPQVYALRALQMNQWGFDGSWTMSHESSRSDAAGKIAYRFHARDVHLVMSPPAGSSLRYRVTLDGKPPGTAQGVDIDAAGNGILDQPRMYQLIRQTGAIADRVIEIEFFGAGAEVFVFTFG